MHRSLSLCEHLTYGLGGCSQSHFTKRKHINSASHSQIVCDTVSLWSLPCCQRTAHFWLMTESKVTLVIHVVSTSSCVLHVSTTQNNVQIRWRNGDYYQLYPGRLSRSHIMNIHLLKKKGKDIFKLCEYTYSQYIGHIHIITYKNHRLHSSLCGWNKLYVLYLGIKFFF